MTSVNDSFDIDVNVNPLQPADNEAESMAQEQLDGEQTAKQSRAESNGKSDAKAGDAESTASPKPPPREHYQDFPSELLPSPMRELVEEGARAIGCDISYIALPLLSAIGAAIGNTIRLVVKKGWNVPPAIWTLICGESGTAKTPAFKLATAPIMQHHQQKLAEYLGMRDIYRIELEKYTEHKKKKTDGPPPERPLLPSAERIVVSDCTVEALVPILSQNPRGLLLQRDELSGWLGSFNAYKATKGADEAAWLSMFDGGSITNDRKSEGTVPIYVESALVSISGGIQPAVLAASMTKEHRVSGMAARFLIAQPPRRAQVWNDDEVSEATLLAVDSLFTKLLAIDFADPRANDPHYVGLSKEAKQVFIKFFNEHHREQTDLIGDDAAAWSKLLGYVPRLALLFHIVKQVPTNAQITASVTVDTIQEAIALVGWFKNEASRLSSSIDDTDEKRELTQVVDWITRKGGEATPSELVRGIKAITSVKEAEALGAKLVRAGLAVWVMLDTPSGTGQQKRVLRVV